MSGMIGYTVNTLVYGWVGLGSGSQSVTMDCITVHVLMIGVQ